MVAWLKFGQAADIFLKRITT